MTNISTKQTDYHPLTEHNIHILTEKICDLVKTVGKLLTDEDVPAIHTKGRADYVTDMDVHVQNELVNALMGLLPDAAFILEEQDVQPELGGYTWIIDPIDGTQNYINHYHQSAICIALLCGTKSVLGVVYNPFYNELFTGIEGNGAFLNGRPIKASKKEPANAIICYGTAPYRMDLRARTIETFRRLYDTCADFRRSGSAALDLCAVACGRADGFFEYSLCPWDYSAASIIIREAGGKITHIDEADWSYTKRAGIVAGNTETFPFLKEIVEKE